jgi:hypothetical protein
MCDAVMKKGLMGIGMKYIIGIVLGVLILVLVMINFGAPVLIAMLNATFNSTIPGI